jgi:hypothetical protein
MLKTLGLPKTTSPGNAVLPKTTVLFTAPLYRPNLRYSIVPKPASAAAVIESMVDYILDTHQGDTGIICELSSLLPRLHFHQSLTESSFPQQTRSLVLTRKPSPRVSMLTSARGGSFVQLSVRSLPSFARNQVVPLLHLLTVFLLSDHAYIEDSEKLRVQEAWKTKKIVRFPFPLHLFTLSP